MRKREIIRTNENKPDYKADEYLFSVVWSEEDEVFIGRVVEFPSLAAHGKTLEDALRETKELVSYILEDLRESGEFIPEPFSKRNFSGKLNLRMPPQLHRQLTAEAEREGVSLNQWINRKLSAQCSV
jgi:predicted HicB family RNase H-like nuclease